MLTGYAATVAEGDPLPPDDHAAPTDDEAMAVLYRAEQPRLINALRRGRSIDQAADLVQQAFLRFVGLGTGRRSAIAAPSAYLRQTAINLSTDAARAAARHSAARHVPDDSIDLEGPDQIAQLEARDMLNRLEIALQRLKPRTREIFLAHRLDGYSYIEIASKTGLSVKGVEKHMSRAIAYIDRVLGDR